MQCKCKYFKYDNAGQLVCASCGKPSPKIAPKIEDKIDPAHEDKAVPEKRGTTNKRR